MPRREIRLGVDLTTAAAPTEPAPSRWGPFSHLAFTVIWTASLVSNVGTAMFDTASGWLITSLDANPITVSLVQVAVSLPLFLFTLPSGALADVIDSRHLLISVEVAILAVSVVFAGLVSLNLATPSLLLATTFLLGVGGALTSPAWGATIPMLVPKQDLDSATAANGVAFNIGRAAGPALGGLVIAALGIAIPFWAFAASNVGIIAALIWWRSPRKGAHGLPAERLASAVRAGVRHAANNPYLGATLVRVLGFFPFASAYLALLPLLARHLISEGPQLYGILLAAIGVGTVGGSLIIRWLKDELGPDRLVAAGSLAAAFALVLFGLTHDPLTAVSACLLGGASWSVVLTKLYVSAQVALPDWARGLRARGVPRLSSSERRPRAARCGETLRHGRPADCRFRGRGGTGSRHSDGPGAGSFRRASGLICPRLCTGVRPLSPGKVENNQGPGRRRSREYRAPRTPNGDRAEFLSAVDELGYARRRDSLMRGESMRTSPTADASSETFSIVDPGFDEVSCISASGATTRRRGCFAAGFANCSKKRRARITLGVSPERPAPALAKARGDLGP